MKNKEKQIEELAKTIECEDMPMTCFSDCRECDYIKEKDNNWFCQQLKTAKTLHSAGYRKPPENIRAVLDAEDQQFVVISREEYEVLKIKEKEKHWLETCMSVWKNAKIDSGKETAEKIYHFVGDYYDSEYLMFNLETFIKEQFDVEIKE